jgi:hypothetical protein
MNGIIRIVKNSSDKNLRKQDSEQFEKDAPRYNNNKNGVRLLSKILTP